MAPASSGQGGGSAGPAGAIRQGGEGRGRERQGRPEKGGVYTNKGGAWQKISSCNPLSPPI